MAGFGHPPGETARVSGSDLHALSIVATLDHKIMVYTAQRAVERVSNFRPQCIVIYPEEECPSS